MAEEYGQTPDIAYSWVPPVRPKFQHRYWLHLLLFVVTLGTTTLTGGFWYSIPVLLILGAHEFGHYVLCRMHDVDATLPYFIPGPPPPILLTGTFGAVIRIRQAFPSTRALFDIGIAGPIAGFVVLVPFLAWGIHYSQVLPIQEPRIWLGEPLLIKAIIRLQFGVIPTGYDVSLHPMAFAAWWGMLATALNLMPFGQLDGGHIVYSLVGRRAWMVSVATLAGVVLLTVVSWSWIAMTIMLLVMALVLGVHHPRVIDDTTSLGTTRRLLAVFALVMFLLCFTPVPIEVIFGS